MNDEGSPSRVEMSSKIWVKKKGTKLRNYFNEKKNISNEYVSLWKIILNRYINIFNGFCVGKDKFTNLEFFKA